jgi:hypothetical protein
MKKFVTFAGLAGAALVLSACGKKAEEAPAAVPTAEEMMAPVETPMADATPEMVDEAAAAAEGLDPTGNPIGPGKSAPAAE